MVNRLNTKIMARPQKNLTRYKNERQLKTMLDYAEKQAKHWKDYGFHGDTTYWHAKAVDLRAQLFALYHEREEFDKLDTI